MTPKEEARTIIQAIQSGEVLGISCNDYANDVDIFFLYTRMVSFLHFLGLIILTADKENKLEG